MRIKTRSEVRQNGPPPRLGLKASSPGAVDEDCNSNTSLAGSQHSAHDAAVDFDTHYDNSDYLWFLDYNPLFRDGSCHHTSVLSSVSASYKGISDLTSRFEFTSRYNDLARDLDANLAEADMESFKTEDIHALLMTANLPHDTIIHHDERTHDGEESVASMNTMSICKSELLFSPVREPTHMAVHFSVDSLDCDLLTEQDLILTCQANKDNYTIAFEGSVTNYSEDSECAEPAVINKHDKNDRKLSEIVNNDEKTRRNLELLEKCHKLTNKLVTSMARSDLGFTTWSKLKKQNSQSQLKRHPSGNNNEDSNELNNSTGEVSVSVIKSQSLPNLYKNRKLSNSSIHSTALTNSTVDSFTTHQRLTSAGACMKVYDVAHNANCISMSHGSQHSEPMSTSSTENQSSSDKSQTKQPFNLVKLFMKQKSMSNEGIVGMDQIDRAECWPSSSDGESGESLGDSKIKTRKMLPRMNTSDDQPGQDDDNNYDDVPDEYTTIYEDVVTTVPTINACNNTVFGALVIEEEESVDAVECRNVVLSDSESNLYATVNKPHPRRNNLNNNVTHSPLRLRNNLCKKSCSSQSSATSVSISSCSESDGTQITRMHRAMHRDPCDNKATSTEAQVETIDRSIQTSTMGLSHLSYDRDLIRIIEPSFLEKLKKGDCAKPVFVLYPNYTLPDISFLNGRPNIYLNPQKIQTASETKDSRKNKNESKGKRPFSCNDLELLRKKGFSHIRDWDSLSFLLPTECKQLLSEVPEIMHHLKDREVSSKCRDKYNSPASVKPKTRPMSCDCNNLAGHNTAVSSSSSTATQPSSGYRGSSTILTDSSAQNSPAPIGNFNPLFVYRYDSATSSEASYVINEAQRTNPTVPKRSVPSEQVRLGSKLELAPPRPPLPKSILRKSIDKTRKSGSNTKRYSMFEMDEFLQDPVVGMTEQKTTKRRSLQEPYYLQKQNSHLDHRKNNDLAAKRMSQHFLDAAEKDEEYNEFYHDEGVGTESSLESGKSNEPKYHRPQTPPLPKPRTKKMEYTEFPPPGALISSADLQQLEDFLKESGVSCHNMDDWDQNQVQKGKNLAVIPICEEAEVSPDEYGSPIREAKPRYDIIDISQKRALVSNVTDAVEMLIQHFSPATDQAELAFLGDSKQSPACAKIALNALCPALYAIFRDGLKENIETSFGAVNNSVWQMVETTSRQGPITKSLNELVLRINGEDAVTEGLVKFNAFILGLLNAQSADAWVSYMRTRESVLQKHYRPDALLLAGCAGDTGCKALLDTLLAGLEPLRLLPFHLDLMFEMRELHRSFKRIESDMRAASRLESSGEEGWGGGQQGGKFRRLQLKWELLSNAESPPSTTPDISPAAARGSKIPRPVSSPVRPQAPPLASPVKNSQRCIPVAVRKGSSPTTVRAPPGGTIPRVPPPGTSAAKTVAHTKRTPQPANRTSRLEQGRATAAPRPSSLPYGRAPSAVTPRRAASSNARAPAVKPSKPRYVRTLWHRLPSDSGHLAFNEGERLRLVLEVDDQYLLCCRGDHKGLVPRDAVIQDEF